MLWVEKYKPRKFDDFTTHKENINALKCYKLENLPNLIVYGGADNNKKSIIYALIEQMYGKYPSMVSKNTELKINSTVIQISYLESDEVIQICPSNYGFRDKYVVQHLIKEMVQTRPIMSMMKQSTSILKLVIIDHAENLSRDAQAALRRTMEIYSRHCRIVLLCSSLSKIIEPLRSRCMYVRVPSFSSSELQGICADIASKEDVEVEKNIISEIVDISGGNAKRAIGMLELYCFRHLEDTGVKRLRSASENLLFEWEVKINEVAEILRSKPRIESLAAIRRGLYEILNSCVPENIILHTLIKSIAPAINHTSMERLYKTALKYEERMCKGSKAIYHLEALVVHVMSLLMNKSSS
ncbi:replication factor C subunit 3/5 [Enteropsectra breve]|nr:replication factor C subunit 3/5 [Enteropsectra breve]